MQLNKETQEIRTISGLALLVSSALAVIVCL